MKINIRKSEAGDLGFLEELETMCFPKSRQSSRRALRYSLSSPFQKVIIAEITENRVIKNAGAAILFLYPKTLRVFSIAVLPDFQGKDIGSKLLEQVVNIGRAGKFERISLEVLKLDIRLTDFYKKTGFKITEELPDYYQKGEHGLRMVLTLEENSEKQNISNIVIVRNPLKWNLNIEGVKVISSKKYMTDPEFQSIKNVRIFNLS